VTKIVIIGSSVALYVRPRDGDGRLYGHLLEDLGASSADTAVQIWAENSMTVREAVHKLEDRLVAEAPNWVILHLGIVECTPRILPQRLRRRFVRARTSLERLWLAAEALVRRPLVAVLGGAPSMAPRTFEQQLTRLIGVARREARAQVVCIGIPATSERVEEEVPGVGRSIRRFDEAIRGASRRTGAQYLDLEVALREIGLDRGRPDGIHLSGEGHRLLAAELKRRIGADDAASPVSTSASTMAATGQERLLRVAALGPGALLVLLAFVWIPFVRLWRRARGGERD
jgi:lysophospholipase L1-like esterase